MNPASFRVRRATLDDMPQLAEMWKAMHFSVDTLSKRITEFQVAESPEGKVVGALALQMAEKHGLIHSEAFGDFSYAEHLRPILWDRIHAVAVNHGLLQLWTQENAPFWNHCGLIKPDPETLAKLPSTWRAMPGAWLTIKLKDDVDALISADKEFSAFMAAEKEKTQRTFQQAKVLKIIATLIALGVVALVFVAGFYILKRNPHFFGK